MFDTYEIMELHLLELLDNDIKWWTIEEISVSLGVSKATVQKNINKLKERLKAYDSRDISLQTSTNRGVFLHRQPDFSTRVVHGSILKNLLVFSVLDQFLYNEHNSIVQLSMDHYVSIASIRRKYRLINSHFKELNIELKRGQLLGDEKQIRWFYSTCYWEIFRGTEWPFQLVYRDFMEDVLKQIQNFFDIKIVPEVKEEMMYWISVNAIRHLKGYRVPEDMEVQKYTENNPLFLQFITIMKSVFPNEAKNNDPKGLGEMQYLFFLLSALPVMEKHSTFSRVIHQAHKDGNTIMYQITQEWIDIFKFTFGSIESEEQRYRVENKLLRIHSLSYLYHRSPSPLSPLFQERFMEEITIHYPKSLKGLEAIYEKLSLLFPEITDNKNYLIESYALLAIEEFKLKKFERKVRLALSFSKGLIYESVIQSTLKTTLEGKYNLSFVNYTEEKDILITDLPNSTAAQGVLVIKTGLYLTKRDYQNIESVLKDLH